MVQEWFRKNKLILDKKKCCCMDFSTRLYLLYVMFSRDPLENELVHLEGLSFNKFKFKFKFTPASG